MIKALLFYCCTDYSQEPLYPPKLIQCPVTQRRITGSLPLNLIHFNMLITCVVFKHCHTML